MSDREIRSAIRLFRDFRAQLAAAHALERDPLVAGDLMRAWANSDRVRLDLESALQGLTTTMPTTAKET